MHPEILEKHQAELLPLIGKFNKSFFLVGGTAIAFHLGHRRSVDFDLFSPSALKKKLIKNKLSESLYSWSVIFEDSDQLHLNMNNVKITFFHYPYQIKHPVRFNSIITYPTLLTLSSMKAFALGRRAKWKDYVDLFFILKYHYSINEICDEANLNFGKEFSAKLFREQLAFHKDIDYSEPIEYLVPSVPENEIKEFLIDKATDITLF